MGKAPHPKEEHSRGGRTQAEHADESRKTKDREIARRTRGGLSDSTRAVGEWAAYAPRVLARSPAAAILPLGT